MFLPDILSTPLRPCKSVEIFSIYVPLRKRTGHILLSRFQTIYLSNGDSQDEPGRGAVGVTVKVPLAVNLARQCLIGDVSDQPLRQPQANLISKTAAF